MLDFFKSIGETITNIFNFIVSSVETFIFFCQAVSDFFASAGNVIAIFPGPVQAIIYACLALLVAFIVVELLRDFL